MCFNLLTEPWIPVLYADGRNERLGIRRVLQDAGQIRQIAASNPMDRVALLRFLLAALMWCKDDAKAALATLKDGSVGIPEDWLAKLNEHKPAFNLLGDSARFYQDCRIWDAAKKREDEAKKTKDKPSDAAANDKVANIRDGVSFRPVGDLMQEFPTESKIIHFRHVRDYQYGFCPACCAVGLIRFSAFASAYAQVIPAGINGPTPAYAIPTNATLLATLLLNWPTSTVIKDSPGWECDGGSPPEKDAVGALAAFTWRPRRIWLGELSKDKDVCASCGEVANLIERMAFGPGRKSPFTGSGKDKKFWPSDQHLLLAASQKKAKAKAKRKGAATKGKQPAAASTDEPDNDQGQPIGFPSPSLPVGIHARFWRTALRTALGDKSRVNLANAMQVMGPAANKALYQDAAAFQLPSISDADKSKARGQLETIGRASESLSAVLRRATPNPDRQHPNRKDALEALTASLEANLRVLFAADVANAEQTAIANECARIIRQVVESTTSGSPLHRRLAQRHAESLLQQAFEKMRAEEP